MTLTNGLYLPYPYRLQLTIIKINATCWPNYIRVAWSSLRLVCFSFAEINKLFIVAFSPLMLRNCTSTSLETPLPLLEVEKMWAFNYISQ